MRTPALGIRSVGFAVTQRRPRNTRWNRPENNLVRIVWDAETAGSGLVSVFSTFWGVLAGAFAGAGFAASALAGAAAAGAGGAGGAASAAAVFTSTTGVVSVVCTTAAAIPHCPLAHPPPYE